MQDFHLLKMVMVMRTVRLFTCRTSHDERIGVRDTVCIGDLSLYHWKVRFAELVATGFGFRFLPRHRRNQIDAITLGSHIVLIASVRRIGDHLVGKKVLLGKVLQNFFQCIGIALMSLLRDRGNNELNVVFVTTGF